MLRDLVEQIVRRRLWPIPLVAIVVVVAAPLLFLKSAPQGASPAAAVAPAPSQADLPARAQRLLTTSDAAVSGRRLSRSPRDPFQGPSSDRGAAPAKVVAATKSSSRKAATKSSSKQSDPVPVVTQNADGSKNAGGSAPAAAQSPAVTSGGRNSTARSSESSSKSWRLPTVDVRFAAQKDSPIRRRIARRTTFEVGGKVVLVFVKYSHSRHKAVFAVRATTGVHGDIRCRRIDGICRYVEIPVGRYVRFTFVNADGSRVSRRMDVVRVHDDA
jgi:hypothetical protein